MTGRQIIGIALSLVVAYIIVRIAFAVIGFIFSTVWLLVGVAVVGGVAYLLYNKFNNMLTSGKRLT